MGHRSTRLQRQIERHLSGTLADYVARRRAEQVTWRNLAIELTEATGVEVSYEALRSWFDSGETAAVS